MTDCYIYTRVSSSKQVKEGEGLQSQRTTCLNFAKNNKFNVIKIYAEEGKSAYTKGIYRPELDELFSDLQKNKNHKILLVDSASRLTRNLQESLYIFARLQKLKTKFQSADMSLPDGITGELMRNIITIFNQFEAQNNQLRVFHRMHACMENKRYIFNPPFGYERYTDKVNGKIIRPDGIKSLAVKELLEKFASNQIETIADAQRFLALKFPVKNNNYTYRNKQALRILKNSSIYAGLIIYNKQDEKLFEKKWSVNTKGHHKAIISENTHQKIQQKLNNPRKVYKTNNSEIFVLRGGLKCNGCGGNMTSNFSTSKSKKKIGYYRCNNFECNYEKKNINQKVVEKTFKEYLSSLSFRKDYQFIIEEIVNIVAAELKQETKYEIRDIKIKIDDLKKEVISLVEKLTKDEFNNLQEELNSIIIQKKSLIMDLEAKLPSTKYEDRVDKSLREILECVSNLPNYWLSINSKSKKDLINLIFPKGFKFNLDKKITTPQLSIPFNDFRDNFSDKSHLVEPRGIEPLTSTLPA